MRQALARTWRPKTFDEVIGQAHVVRALSNALERKHLHHAYLFTGTRGVGKTTIARIIAKSLNCEQGISAKPCGECTTCKEIDSGRFIDLFEVDAASRTKVEDTRELLDNVQYTPTKGRYKIYLIDEVHMLSSHSFNALLKTLEEPPPHVKFLLATTDPQKLPATVLSRCLQFHLTHMTPDEIAGHLQTILQKETVEFDIPATQLLSKAANGSMRDALSLLDQSIAYGDGKVLTADIKSMLGTIEPTALYDILAALSQQDANALLECSAQLNKQGANYAHALNDLLSLLHQITITQVIPDATTEADSVRIKELAQQISQQDIQLYYQSGIIGQRDLPLAPSPRTGFEMVLLRMLAFTPNNDNAPTIAVKKPTVASNNTATASASTATATATTTAAKPAPTRQATNWAELLPQLSLNGPTLALAKQCSAKTINDKELILTISTKHKAFLNQRHIDRIREAYSQYCGGNPTQVRIDIEASDEDTPASLAKRETETQQQAAEKAILGDQTVQQIMQTFDATVIKDSIIPVKQH